MAYFTAGPPATELHRRITTFQTALQAQELDGALIIQKTDLFYFSGTSQQGWLYVPAQGLPLLMIFKEFDRAIMESALERVVSLVSPKKIPGCLAEYGYPAPKSLGLELDVLPANLYFQYLQIFNGSAITDVSTSIRLVRAVKSEYEIDAIHQAAVLSDKVAARAAELIEVGKQEVALAGEVEAFARSLGHQGIVRMRMFGSELFYGHLLSGQGAATPSYLASPTGGEGVSTFVGQGAGFKEISRNEPILLDYVFALNGYISDHSRIFVMGELDQELERAHEDMLKIQEWVRANGLPGAVSGELYNQMVNQARDMGWEDYFMGAGERRIRFTGHGVGLELDEFPFIARGQKLELEAGMIVALEPKVVIPGKGVVGIENTHLVTTSGLESLTTFEDTIYRLP